MLTYFKIEMQLKYSEFSDICQEQFCRHWLWKTRRASSQPSFIRTIAVKMNAAGLGDNLSLFFRKQNSFFRIPKTVEFCTSLLNILIAKAK